METLVKPSRFAPSHLVNTSVATLTRFSFFAKPINRLQPTLEYSLLDAYHYIKSGISAQATTHLRSLSPIDRASFKRSNFETYRSNCRLR